MPAHLENSAVATGQFSFLSQRKVKVTPSCPCWKLLRVPWTARRSNQSILKETNPEYSLEGLMLKLKFQYFGHLMWRADALEKTLMLGGEAGNRGWDGWIASMGMSLSKLQRWWRTGEHGMLQTTGSHRVRCDLVTDQQQSEFSWGPPERKLCQGPLFPKLPQPAARKQGRLLSRFCIIHTAASICWGVQ